ncbi:COX15/CtaA family protein [Methylobacterium nodulans]|uniref:Heme A synthase n=1 Tax=Methylobacterium nodulans (strain LMG 21967 / CNCM I-2342 / ORS 2060) TaxID=460265 RepID=CTAA_METNO|nr:COX15/CtaA family protein [Methylobacterium nodulans]B8ISP2.1 RecName: Full=Heme A synthase; Short=HAS; AltName: Full=Cytochrome aa3-controlling protein [Methylobacterium nodulans ORS 2060]ACL60691.1 cytochrome oxidase assembly [Methylobacterium nodulans ORS 2060]
MTSAALAPSSAAPAGAGAAPRSRAAVRRWLFAMAALVIAMVAVGGATRLTGSGLSITEWKPVTGAIPPLSAEAWTEEFAKYRATPQYDILNRGMSLAEFQVIYAWEWGHRFLGRLIGFAFFLPLGWFWWTGRLDRRLGLGLLGLGVLGGLQGAVGWIMVASGLQPGMTAVAPIKLAAHLTLASAIFAGLVWLAAGLDRAPDEPLPRRLRLTALALPLLMLVQIALGGLVAGSKAGLTYNTWPLMDGAFIPPLSGLFAVTPWIENFVDNVALVQLNHRLAAYGLLAVAALHWLDLFRTRPGSRAAKRAGAILGLVTAQAALGITTLLLAVPLWAGLAHQVTAMLVLGMAAVHARIATLSRA